MDRGSIQVYIVNSRHVRGSLTAIVANVDYRTFLCKRKDQFWPRRVSATWSDACVCSQDAEEAIHRGIVVPVSGTVHADPDAMALQQLPIRAANKLAVQV